jgi:phosphopantothenoylcysteine decarboxylase / phosphopantothenate---cysteine ligase
LEPTKDILMEVAAIRAKIGFPRITVGFAAESERLLENASEKMKKKNLDMIVANDISRPESGFEVDTNQVTLLMKDGVKERFPLMSKAEVADLILSRLIDWLAEA